MTSRSQLHFDTVVIGGGQAGLSIGYYLEEQDRDFLILDASDCIGDTWRNRWDSLRLFTLARNSSLPGMSFPASDDYFPTKDEMADYLQTYATELTLPIRLNTRVKALIRNNDYYVLQTESNRLTATNVVVATGPFQRPYIPKFADELTPSITQLHSSDYQNPAQLPAGSVLVVGAGNSGAEIAVELTGDGRSTWLSGRDTGHIPCWLFNSRLFWWLSGTIFTVDTWLGRKIKKRSLGQGDPLIRLTPADIRQSGVERVARTEGMTDGKPRLEDGQVLDVDVVVWATGFRPGFEWIDLPGLTLDENGYPIHEKGVVTEEPGLYFLGLPFQRTPVSATIRGVGPDAEYIALRLNAHH
ncbi:flavin-containing monooxygenase [Halosolutus gelatinilyticus]|uniref:flavin-containing monooxygenase n=1 Tax=Halosolutus gelatinilyticus TaxID=2931975 RepID=UPI001FF5CA61|nr:NAD(P)/FAD-dependent oxidoreductase [Halosolutus gelatinilyticus]